MRSSSPTISAPACRRQCRPRRLRMHDASVLRHRQVGAEREFLEHTANARRSGPSDGVGGRLVGATDADGAVIRRSVPASTFMSVDLPAPLCPTRPTHSPASTCRSTPLSARTAPYALRTPCRLARVAESALMRSSHHGRISCSSRGSSSLRIERSGAEPSIGRGLLSPSRSSTRASARWRSAGCQA